MAAGRHGRTYVIALVLTAFATASAARLRRAPLCNLTEESVDSEQSFLWSLKNREPPVYFFGTIHVPYTRVWDYLPDNVKLAFQNADNVFFELNLMDAPTISALANCQMLPSGENLVDILPDDVYQRLKRHLDYVKDMMPTWLSADQRGSGLYADYLFNAIAGNWERKRPIWVMLMVNSLTESDVRTRGIPVLDLYLAQEAFRMDKRTGAVEKVEEQCLPLNGLNFTQVIFALNQTLLQKENLRFADRYADYTTDDLIKHYNCGELDSVYFNKDTFQVPQAGNGSFSGPDIILARNIDEYLQDELVNKRNVRMGERVLKLLAAYPDESFFFAFGAGHFLGNNTVLDYVQSKGFGVEHVSAGKKLWRAKKPAPGHGRRRHKGVRAQADASAWDEESAFHPHRGGRRKYRKRQNQHHHGVQLLRTWAATTTTPRSYPRAFNDLWIKIDSVTRAPSRLSNMGEYPKEDYFQDVYDSWYDFSNSGHGLVSVSATLSLFCIMMSLWLL